MKYVALTFFLISLLFPGAITAQDKQYTTASDSDPEAVALLKSIRAKYDTYQTLMVDFSLEINLPGAGQELQRGEVKRRGDLVRFRLGGQEGIVTEEAAYVVQHANKEVIISNLPEPGEADGMLTPQTLFSFYEGDGFVVALQNKETVDGRLLQAIELKPLDRYNSDFSKLRLLVDPKRRELVSVKAFTPDGANFVFRLGKVTGNPAFAAGTFRFSKEEFPGYHIEDLR